MKVSVVGAPYPLNGGGVRKRGNGERENERDKAKREVKNLRE